MSKNPSSVISVSHYKILLTVEELNNLHFYPNQKGVRDILNGLINENTISLFDKISTFGTLISIQGRRLCAIVNYLTRNNYLEYVIDENNDTYLKITQLGKSFNKAYIVEHKVNLKPKKINTSKDIIKM